MAKATVADIRRAILRELPKDGTAFGNIRLRDLIADRLGAEVDEDLYCAARDELIARGKLAKGQGRGGSVRRTFDSAEAPALTLEAQEVPEEAKRPKAKSQPTLPFSNRKPGEPKKAVPKGEGGVKVIAYRHDAKRRNNPDVGVVTPETDPDQPKTVWSYDPHIDPALQFDVGRAHVEKLIDDALLSGDDAIMRTALETLKRMSEPYLNWTGKAERASFEIDTVSLHVHERIDPSTILASIRKRMQKGKEGGSQTDLFRAWFEEPLPHREAIEFYKHDRGWSNRLVAGDSLLVMNSLLHKESMAGQVQMLYIDPPYGIKYGSNFQPFVNKRDVKDRADADLTQEPEMIKAFRDTWELGIHSYLAYLRDRLMLAKALLAESGSVFVQISDENLHLTRNVLDDVFGAENFLSLIPFRKKTMPMGANLLENMADYLLWYAKSKQKVKYRQLFVKKTTEGDLNYRWFQDSSGARGQMTSAQNQSHSLLAPGARPFHMKSLEPSGVMESGRFTFHWLGESWKCPVNGWASPPDGMRRISRASRLEPTGGTLRYVLFEDDYPVSSLTNPWNDVSWSGYSEAKTYVVQTNSQIVQRCLLMTTDPGDLVLDPTCGSGTTAFVAEKWGRRWITCDTSRVAVTLAKQRLMTASFDYYDLKYPHEGLKGGFIYRTVPHVTLKSIANNSEVDEIWDKSHPEVEKAVFALNAALKQHPPSAPFPIKEGGRKGEKLFFAKGASLQEWEVPFDFPTDWPALVRTAFDAFHVARRALQQRMDRSIAAHADQETLYDQPQIAKDKLRITGPFTVEAVPFPTVLTLEEGEQSREADASIARSGESARQHGWREELLKTGIRGKGGQMLKFAELETLPDTRHLHCTGHLDSGERVVVSFGPEYAALEQRQVELAMREASELFPRPKMIVFSAFTFDPEAAKDIDVTKGIIALRAQMNTDLLTEDLKKNRSSNQSFWLMGQPDVDVRQNKDGKYVVEVNGYDYFDTIRGELVSGGKGKIAAWSLDINYDERSLFPSQVFFPMAGAKDGWNKLKRDIKAELNEAMLDKLHGTVSLPFEAGDNRKIAVKIVDDRGIESLKVMALD